MSVSQVGMFLTTQVERLGLGQRKYARNPEKEWNNRVLDFHVFQTPGTEIQSAYIMACFTPILKIPGGVEH